MKRVKKFMALLLLTIGIPISLLAIAKLPDRNLSKADRDEVILALMFFGAVPTASASYLLWDLHRHHQRAKRDRLYATFFELVRAGQGRLSVLDFAIATQLPGSTAKAFLDDRAREFDATFDVTDSGGVFYQFPVGVATLLPLSAAATYTLILDALPDHNRRAIMRTLHKLTGLDWKVLRSRLRDLPAPISTGLSQDTAATCRTQLESLGATVTLVLD
ncbi:MAG TPA: hypothetical protein V6C88_02105 [Chroococcidiopsis sp.]